jgi:hypothetical protein
MTVSRFVAALQAVITAFTLMWAGQSAAFDGYTFVFNGNKAQLYDMDKSVVHEWTTQYDIEGCADLLRDSSIIVSVKDPGAWEDSLLALPSGRFQILSWKGDVTWDFTFRSADYMPHHDIEPVYRTNDPHEQPTFLIPCYTKTWGDKIVEIKPTGPGAGEVIWEWVGNDHTCESLLCRDRGDLLDKSKGGNGTYFSPPDSMHVNGISYNRTLDQLVVSSKGFNELFVIDHSTTTAEAKGATGGRYGKGGSLLYRWGNPSNYGAPGPRFFRGQHHACWVQDTMIGTALPSPGALNIMAVDNGNNRIIEIIPAGTKNGVYPRASDTPFGPASPLWIYAVSDMEKNEGSVQRLPNGNTLICTGGFVIGVNGEGDISKKTQPDTTKSRVFEVTSSNKIVWEMSVPTSTEAYRYAYGYFGRPVDALRQGRVSVRPISEITFIRRPGDGGFIACWPQRLTSETLVVITDCKGVVVRTKRVLPGVQSMCITGLAFGRYTARLLPK